MVGTPAGLMTLRLLSPDALRVIIAVIVLAGLAGLIGKIRLRSGPRQAAGAGFLAGLFSRLAAMPGPPAVA